jgi:mRNA interferase MazF
MTPMPSLTMTTIDTTTLDVTSHAGAIRRGDLYWIAPDHARDDAATYAHPHVVVQDDVFNRSRIATVIVCALTTNLGRASEPGNVLLDIGEGDLPKQSVVVVSQIDSVDRSRLHERIGALSQKRVEQILAGLRFQQRAFFRE